MNILPATHPLAAGRTASSALVRALQGVRPDRLPVWFMRQAGRSLPEYRQLRAGTPMLDACLDPEMAAEITLQPVRRHGVDAAIFFSDIVIPLKLAGVEVDIVAGRGPVFPRPVRTAADVERLCAEHPAESLRQAIAPIREAVQRVTAELGATPLIGFAGAPFTLAAYLVEGGPSRDHLRARALMHTDPEAWKRLLAWAAELSGVFLEAQVSAGASAAQLFDSWAGSLSARDYTAHVSPSSMHTLERVRQLRWVDPASADGEEQPVPTIHFAVGADHLLEDFARLGTNALGIDWRIPLDEASARLGGGVPLQGNLNPAFLSAPEQALEAHLREVIQAGRSAPAHVLNLGHGVPPETDPEVLSWLVQRAHALGNI
ncbi:uroporphyrinogen decarboxylase [Leucobacter insecticola]|uniref:Uroporphyrinogen decarboxylase n=1 Tax=Leucobacter insecticola TaxID=2714934 RepID=A0A6G8FGF1_9MICO|nr:uroporphyrinogen decarboxylase [Leucobacter insecticola]QIM15596.1 uroporphyrinogen decarboxylase [Leucobacter insecticola]